MYSSSRCISIPQQVLVWDLSSSTAVVDGAFVGGEFPRTCEYSYLRGKSLLPVSGQQVSTYELHTSTAVVTPLFVTGTRFLTII